MGTILRLLLTRFLPGRLAWMITAFLVARAMTRRKEPVPVRQPITRSGGR